MVLNACCLPKEMSRCPASDTLSGHHTSWLVWTSIGKYRGVESFQVHTVDEQR